MRHTLALCLLAALLPLGCAEHNASNPPPSQSNGHAGATDAPATAASGAGSRPWAEAVRMERWAEAASLIDALPEAERSRPEMRYVRARAALAAKESALALKLLDGLEQRLPDLAVDVARWRAEAAFEVGPHAEAAAYFARSVKAKDLVRAAEAYEKAGDAASARQAAERAVTAAQRSKNRRDEASARAARARLSGGAADTNGAADLRWIAIHAPLTPEGRTATEALDKQKLPLSMKERLSAIAAMLETGGATEALAELNRIEEKPGAPMKEIRHLRATALYKARSYAEAAKAFQASAAGKSGREAEELLYSARALARLGRQDEAIKRYAEVADRYKATPWGEQSAYLKARSLMQVGRYGEAYAAYTHYLATFPRGTDRADAEVERALSLLSAGNPQDARKQLGLLVQKAKGDQVGKLRELEGVAALRAGDTEGAVKVWTEVVRTYPLSFAALAARSRLMAAGAQVPPLLGPGPGGLAAATAGASVPAPGGPSASTAPGTTAAPAASGAPVGPVGPAGPVEPVGPAPLQVALPPDAALLVSLGLDADAESRLASNEQAAAARYVGRESEALCGMYGMLSRAKRRYRVGSAAVGYSMLMRAPTQGERWAWDCIYPRPYEGAVRALEEQYGLQRGLLHALMRQESAFDPAVVSPAAAVGLMQLIPPTASRVAAELSMTYNAAQLTSPEVNLKFGAYYISKLLKMFQGSLTLASAAYNGGPHAASQWLEVGSDNEVDLWVARIPYDETRNYVARVAGNLARYQWLEGGDQAVQALPLALPEGVRAPADAY